MVIESIALLGGIVLGFFFGVWTATRRSYHEAYYDGAADFALSAADYCRDIGRYGIAERFEAAAKARSGQTRKMEADNG